MSATLEECLTLLSKDIGDYWAGTLTSNGAAGGTTIIDTALMVKANDWIADAPQEMYDRVTSGTYDNEERKISSLDNSTGTLTLLAHGGQIASGVTYEVHRLFSASDKRRALIDAAKLIFPHCYRKINDTSRSCGNWLRNGDVEDWAVATYPDYWRVSAVTATATTTAKLFKRGAKSCKLSTAAGYMYQNWTYWDDLKYLRGHSVTFRVYGTWCDTASCLRLAIYDGTDTTYSDYHAGDSAWTDDDNPLEVTAFIDENASEVEFRVYHSNAAGTSYVDDMRVVGPYLDRIYVGDLNLALDRPHTVEMQQYAFLRQEPWYKLSNVTIDENGYMLLTEGVRDYQLRIRGIGYLSFQASSVDSELWTATIDINDPQTRILSARAAYELYLKMFSPNSTSGDRTAYGDILKYWEYEVNERASTFGMPSIGAKTNWGF